jgi:ABC-type transport system substrate-binding protein
MGLLLAACGTPWNSPYPHGDSARNILFASFSERPKHLDPARSYSSNEVVFTGQIYEPPLQYHYLKRPYTLIPLTARAVPAPVYLDARGQPLADGADDAQVATSVYEIGITAGIRYQPHPCFARDAQGRLLYHDLSAAALARLDELADLPETGTRELIAADYVHQIKRLADPRVNSPILGLMGAHIVGLDELATRLRKQQAAGQPMDLEHETLAGVEVVDRYRYRIRVKGRYPQLLYWLAMPFFAPLPPEAEHFYAQPGLSDKNITLDWYPVGTGPYYLAENDPNRRMVLERNPYFHGERYPAGGMPDDDRAGLLADAGRALPFIERVIFSLEQEDIPYWSKFLQGYYDVSGISSDSFDQAIRFGGGGEAVVSETLAAQDIHLLTDVAPSSFYLGFNMQDPVVGGLDERARKLRQALAIAIDQEEYITIFANGRGIPAQGPIPPGIFGHLEGEPGHNPVMYDWVQGRAQRKSIAYARQLLAEAGYANGVDAQNGAPLTLHLDTTASGPDDKARLDWLRKQFAKLDLQLVVRDTDYNRFQDKMARGTAQLFQWGWNADYPDPENFLFLLYGPNGKVAHQGENAANYHNPGFDRLFERMAVMDNGMERQAIIDEMVAIVRHDAPWVWGFHPKQYSLNHAWLYNIKPNQMANNTLKYRRLDPALRARMQQRWNTPRVWPLALAATLLVLAVLPAIIGYRRRERAAALGDVRGRGPC